jgi:hypothetical protein
MTTMTTARQSTKTTNRVRTALLAAAILGLGIARSAPAAICLDCPPVDPPPPPPPPSISVPHFAFQFTPCPSATDLAQIGAALKSGLISAEKQLDLKHNDPSPNPDVRTSCVSGIAKVAAWLFPVGAIGSWDTSAARNAGLSQIKLLQPYETFGFRVTRDALDLLIDLAWVDIPWDYNTAGQADPSGPIHLDNFKIGYYDSVYNIPTFKLVDTRINGHYDGPFTQINFYAGVGDYLWLTQVPTNGFTVGRIVCTSNSEWGMDTTLETILATVFGALHGVDSMIDSFTIEGPACQIASMLPLQTLVGTSGKVVFDYKRLNVGADGITTGGTMPFTYRNPAVKIKGPSPLVAQVGEPAEATYTLDITDMKPPYKVTWTANGVTETNSFTSRSITWDLGNAKPVSYLYKTISVKVVDADGAQASATQTFSIKVVWDTGEPPICHLNPKLPQCQLP